MNIDSTEQLRALYGYPRGRAKDKLLRSLEKHSINFIENSPFITISTVSKNIKMDVSPRGGQAGFVKIIDDTTLAIPDAKGNNRLDSLMNIIETSQIGILFLIPGIDETLRINGSAFISTDSKYLDLFHTEQHPPKTCIIVKIEELFLHCAKALMRSKLWDVNTQITHDSFPTMGVMLKEQLLGSETVESQEDMVKRYQEDL